MLDIVEQASATALQSSSLATAEHHRGAGCRWSSTGLQTIVLEGIGKPFWDFTILVGQFAEELGREIFADILDDTDPACRITVRYMPTEQALADVLPWGIDPDDRGEPHIEELMDAMRRGEVLPPCLADQEGILDGRHRIHAASRLGMSQIPYILLSDTLAPEYGAQ
jgi:ParB-like nuclease domain